MGLVAGEEVASVDFLFNVLKVVGETVGDDDGAGVFEGVEVAGDGAAVKLRLVQGRFGKRWTGDLIFDRMSKRRRYDRKVCCPTVC